MHVSFLKPHPPYRVSEPWHSLIDPSSLEPLITNIEKEKRIKAEEEKRLEAEKRKKVEEEKRRIEEEKKEITLKFAKKLLDLGMSVEDVAKEVGIDEEELKILIKNF